MAGNGWKWLEIAGMDKHGWKLLKWINIAEILLDISGM